jgi:hypothetical protein
MIENHINLFLDIILLNNFKLKKEAETNFLK